MNTSNLNPDLIAKFTPNGMMIDAHYLIKKALLMAPRFVNILLCNIATARMNLIPAGLLPRHLPASCRGSLGWIGWIGANRRDPEFQTQPDQTTHPHA